MAESSGKTAKRKRGAGRPFQKGQSGNPGGRPRSFGTLVRELTGDGGELVQFALAVMRADTTALLPKLKPDAKAAQRVRALLTSIPALKDRLDAHHWLSDQGWGKAPVREDEFGELTPEELIHAMVKDDACWQRFEEERARVLAERGAGGEDPVLQ